MVVALYKASPSKDRRRKQQRNSHRSKKDSSFPWRNLSLIFAVLVYAFISNLSLSNQVNFSDYLTINESVFVFPGLSSLASSSSSNTNNNNSNNNNNNNNNNAITLHRYDDAGLRPIPGLTRSHRLPNAVPPSRTIPPHLALNKTYHLSQRGNTSKKSIKLPRLKDGRYNWENHDYAKDFRTLYYYNPAVLPLFRNVDRHNNNNNNNHNNNNDVKRTSSVLPTEILRALTGGDESVKYVVAYQTYLGSNCFGPDPKREIMTAGEQVHYSAIALMDEHLNLIPDTDILIDINAGPGYGKYFRQFRADCRLFAMRGNIFLLCNEYLHRLEIIRQQQQQKTHNSSNNNNDDNGKENTKDYTQYATRDNHSYPYLYPNLYGNGLKVIVHNIHNKLGGGKNFQLFTSPKKNNNSKDDEDQALILQGDGHDDDALDYYVQLHPIPHEYRKLSLPAHDETQMNVYPRGWSRDKKSTAPIPSESFATIDALHPILTCPITTNDTTTTTATTTANINNHNDTQNSSNGVGIDDDTTGSNCTNPIETPFWKMHEDHGTSCCVSVDLPLSSLLISDPKNTNDDDDGGSGKQDQQQKSVWVGISHNKLSLKDKFWRDDILHRYDDLLKDQYVSRFIAYSQTPPFDIVAVSGWFCLGHYNNTEESAAATTTTTTTTTTETTATLAGRHRHVRLSLFNETFECPPIHFPSTFTEFVGDSSKAIIGYGVNDCYPMLIVVHKQDIVSRLLGRGF